MSGMSVIAVFAISLIPIVWSALPIAVYFVGRDPVIAICVAGIGFGGSIIIDGLFMARATGVVPYAFLSSLAYMLATALCFAHALVGETDAQHEQRVAAIVVADALPCEELLQQFTPVNPLAPVGVACMEFVQSFVVWVCVLCAWRPARRSPQHAAI